MTNTAVAPNTDPSVSEFQATVTEIREVMRVAGKPVFQIALDHSSFPLHTGPLAGTLTATARSGAILVAPITAVHQDSAGERWHTTEKPMQAGTQVVARILQL